MVVNATFNHKKIPPDLKKQFFQTYFIKMIEY